MVADWDSGHSRSEAVIRAGIGAGLQIGAQVYVSHNGKPVIDGAIGEAKPGTAMRSDTLMLWLSSTKPIAAAAIMQLVERGLAALDDPVAKHIAEFAQNGKQSVTVEHLLTHTGGFRFLDLGDAGTPWPEIIRRICIAPLERDWQPGKRAGYHPYTSWYILAEIVNRTVGSFGAYVREKIFLPLGMDDCWIGMPPEVRDAYGDRLGILVNTENRGADDRPLLTPHPWSTPEGIAACVPGANGHGPLKQFARFYEMLLGGGSRQGTRILSEESVRLMTSRRRVGMFDETFKHRLDWCLGLIPNNRQYGVETVPYGYGRHAGDGAFGHSGSQSSAVFTDPEHGLIVAVVLNGTCGERQHQPRMRSVLDAIYEDLAVTRTD